MRFLRAELAKELEGRSLNAFLNVCVCEGVWGINAEHDISLPFPLAWLQSHVQPRKERVSLLSLRKRDATAYLKVVFAYKWDSREGFIN